MRLFIEPQQATRQEIVHSFKKQSGLLIMHEKNPCNFRRAKAGHTDWIGWTTEDQIRPRIHDTAM